MTEHTDDGRYVVVNGRRWRATDPGIPEQLRSQLVAELMAARREVGAAGRADDDDRVGDARRRVDDAKVALGERGRPWWEPDARTDERRLRAATLTLLRHRAADRSICPSDVARVVGGDQWREAMEPARSVARELARQGELRITSRADELDPDGELRGAIRLRRGPDFPVAPPD